MYKIIFRKLRYPIDDNGGGSSDTGKQESEEIKSLKTSIENLQKELGSLKEENKSLKSELDASKKVLEDTKKDLADTKDAYKEMFGDKGDNKSDDDKKQTSQKDIFDYISECELK